MCSSSPMTSGSRKAHFEVVYTKSPSHKPSSFKLSKMQMCPLCQLLYCTIVLFKVLYCKVKNVFLIFLCFFNVLICVKSSINLSQYSTTQLTMLTGYLGPHCWTYKKTRLTNTLLEQNSFISKGLNVVMLIVQELLLHTLTLTNSTRKNLQSILT